MTNVSKRPLGRQTQAELFSQLTNVIAVADKTLANKFFFELFTPSEQIMFTKRLAAVSLLSRQVSPYRVAKTLHLSPTTVGRLVDQLEAGKFDAVIRATQNKNFDKKKFLQTLDLLLRAGLPPRGKGRWDWLDKLE